MGGKLNFSNVLLIVIIAIVLYYFFNSCNKNNTVETFYGLGLYQPCRIYSDGGDNCSDGSLDGSDILYCAMGVGIPPESGLPVGRPFNYNGRTFYTGYNYCVSSGEASSDYSTPFYGIDGE